MTGGFFPRCKQLGKCFWSAVCGRDGYFRGRLREPPHPLKGILGQTRSGRDEAGGVAGVGGVRVVSLARSVVARVATVPSAAAAAFQDIIEGRPMQLASSSDALLAYCHISLE